MRKQTRINKRDGVILLHNEKIGYLAYYVKYDLLTNSSEEEFNKGGKPPRKEKYLFDFSRIGEDGLNEICAGRRQPVAVSRIFNKGIVGSQASSLEEKLNNLRNITPDDEETLNHPVVALAMAGFDVWRKRISGGAWDYDTYVLMCQKGGITYTVKDVRDVYVLSYRWKNGKEKWKMKEIESPYVLLPVGKPSAEGLLFCPRKSGQLLIAELKDAPRLLGRQWNEGMSWTGCGTTAVDLCFEVPAVVADTSLRNVLVDVESNKVYSDGNVEVAE